MQPGSARRGLRPGSHVAAVLSWCLSSAICATAHEHSHHAVRRPAFDSPEWEPLLGRYGTFNITTSSPEAQRLFRIGLLLTFNFDQTNAKAAFQAAMEKDPECAMCVWGLAYACGPFLNHPRKPADELLLGHSSAKKAWWLAAGRQLSLKEAALIDAMVLRYPADGKPEKQLDAQKAYAKRLRALRTSNPTLKQDPDMMVFDADAAMVLLCDTAGYHFWIEHGDDVPPTERPETHEATALLRAALEATNQTHPFAHHLLIHSTEMSNAEAITAVGSAAWLIKNLKGLQDQHLQHMTSHTFFRTGHYHEAVEGNMEAVASDADYLQHGLVPYGPGHNSAFLVASALWGGERAAAYKYTRVMQNIFENAPGRPDGPDGSLAWSQPMLVAVRFGDWERVEAMDRLPPGNFSKQWPFGYGLIRSFAHLVAAVHQKNWSRAENSYREIGALIPEVSKLYPGDEQFANLAHILNWTASAVLAHARGDLEAAVLAMKTASDVELGMPYEWLRYLLGQGERLS
eukprot:TRINITY_DN41933_c0_g1_i2.p1 TRINITY_DN41933_c0_g1~~TRINITY_DN41933_c0_g1_i2.p1  ORF type:complete len:515 (+),score=113.48 TRINITY_DN41933_c0_g1_i2:67-1611(+)